MTSLILLGGILAGGDNALAQSSARRYLYAIEVISDGAFVRRGSFVLENAAAVARLPGGGLPRDSVILAPRTEYRYWLLEVESLHVGQREFTTGENGRRWSIGRITLTPPKSADRDGDGLGGEAELIAGTDSREKDTDGDGIDDGAEVAQGLDPLDGFPGRTGIIATASTPGTAVDVRAVNDMAIVADLDRGVSIFNIFNGMDPVIVAQIDTPGSATRVASAGRYVTVADGESGLVIIDISLPASARVVHVLPFESDVVSVAAVGELGVVGLAGSELAVVDLSTGVTVERLRLPAAPIDLAFGGDTLYALSAGALHAVSIDGEALEVMGSAASPFVATPNERLFIGGGIAYAVHGKGYNTFRLDDPRQPVLIRASNTAQFGWKQIVLNGSGLALAALGPNRAFDVPHNVSLYDTSDPDRTDVFVTEFPTPGVARSVSIYNGLGYIADHENGLQVLNYVAYDDRGVAPEITLTTSFADDTAEEGQLLRVTANVSDDVQVRNVEFHLDGAKAFTDGNFPFEYRFVTPRIAEQPTFTLRARASDTGGNATWTSEMLVTLTADVTPPRVLRVSPLAGSYRRNVSAVAAFFSEAMDPETIGLERFILNGPPEAPAPVGVEYHEEVRAAFLTFAEDLPPGTYGAELAGEAADSVGNQLGDAVSWTFTVFESVPGDSDGDCLPDALELVLGLDPASTDSDSNGVPDSQEDSDGDGMVNCEEVRRGLDPGSIDSDGDGLTDTEELAAMTDPLLADSDGDGFLDGEEVSEGSDPLVAAETPVPLDTAVREVSISSASTLNEADPTGPPIGEATASNVAVLNEADPTGESIREAVGASVSVRNDG